MKSIIVLLGLLILTANASRTQSDFERFSKNLESYNAWPYVRYSSEEAQPLAKDFSFTEMENSPEREVRANAVNKNTPPGDQKNQEKNNNNCSGKPCEEVAGYPLEAIKRALEATPVIMDLLGSEPDEDDQEQEVFPGRSGTTESTDFCETKTVTKFPKKMTNTYNETKWIIQSSSCPTKPGSCMQGIKEVTCLKEKQACSYSEYFPQGSSSFCEQQYTFKKLYTFNNHNNTIGVDLFKIPCGCSCKLILGDVSGKLNSKLHAKNSGRRSSSAETNFLFGESDDDNPVSSPSKPKYSTTLGTGIPNFRRPEYLFQGLKTGKRHQFWK